MAFRTRFFGGLSARIACALFTLGTSCSDEVIDPREEPIDSYVGEIDGSDAVFAVTATELEVVLYVCGGASSLEHSRWYQGERSGDTAQLSAADGSTAFLRFDGAEQVTGEVVEVDGTRFELEASMSAPESAAGLYGVMDAGCRTGVVVRQSAGDEPVVQGTWCSEEGIFAQVTPIAPIDTSADGFGVRVTGNRRAPARQLLVQSVNPADF